jgi:hypothetical protein
MATDFEEFRGAIEAQGVNLTPRFLGMIDLCNQTLAGWPPTPLWGAVSAAGSLLNRHPDVRLADKPLDIEPFSGHTLTAALGGLINANLTEARPAEGVAVFPSAHDSSGNDPSAEAGFFSAFGLLSAFSEGRRRWLDRFAAGGGVRIVVDEQGAPVLMQQAGGACPAIAVRDVWSGAPYPAGSILKARFTTYSNVPHGVEVVPATAVQGLAFMRLSPYALKPGERPKTWGGYPVPSSSHLARLCIGEIRDVTARAAKKAAGPAAAAR